MDSCLVIWYRYIGCYTRSQVVGIRTDVSICCARCISGRKCEGKVGHIKHDRCWIKGTCSQFCANRCGKCEWNECARTPFLFRFTVPLKCLYSAHDTSLFGKVAEKKNKEANRYDEWVPWASSSFETTYTFIFIYLFCTECYDSSCFLFMRISCANRLSDVVYSSRAGVSHLLFGNIQILW